MALTDIAIKKAAPREKQYRLADGGGMYLEVKPTGAKYWRLKYRYGGKEKVLALGIYPTVTLKEARERREAAKKHLDADIDPGAAKVAEKLTRQANAENTFEAVARKWHRKFSKELNDSHAERQLRRVEVHVFPKAMRTRARRSSPRP
ncbi:tyrosine-type recombinase/integrase [Trinickia mobilis]|uniref:tyrosine-type recombinase/integrase n=1 Tax=Trinickia mobilis TaxID=2816356 RepID=UPI0028683697|nr:Arm DNA-binding domain-containing protein [Trinickia mobilis]